MRVLLVEPDYRRSSQTQMARKRGEQDNGSVGDDTLWYPPLGLMKLARYHKERGDEVRFAYGCDKSTFQEPDLFSPGDLWDRVYITTLFTFNWKDIVRTVQFYKRAVAGTASNIYVGGIMASLMADDIHEETGIFPTVGVLNSSGQIGFDDNVDIDALAPDYSLVDKRFYAINDTYYGYTSRGCKNKCKWCGVHRVEPEYVPYIDIKPMIGQMRSDCGDKPVLRLMDNNVLASPKLKQIVEDLLELGYGRDCHTDAARPSQRVIDFNQGLDASFVNNRTMKLVSQLNLNPMRIAFDRLKEKKVYTAALELAQCHGVQKFSNYMLYNFRDTPRDLYERLMVNIRLNRKWGRGTTKGSVAEVYSYPMRYAPITEAEGPHANRDRDYIAGPPSQSLDHLKDAVWTRRFVRNVEIMKGAAHGAISPTPTLALRTIGETYEEFIANLYMPEVLLQYRNRFEEKVYEFEPDRPPGTGEIETFRAFIRKLLKSQNGTFVEFHEAVSPNTRAAAREGYRRSRNKEVRKWLEMYFVAPEELVDL